MPCFRTQYVHCGPADAFVQFAMTRRLTFVNYTADGEDDDSGGGPYAAQHIGGAAAIGGGGDGDSVNLGMFGEITAAGVQTGMGTIAGFGYG